MVWPFLYVILSGPVYVMARIGLPMQYCEFLEAPSSLSSLYAQVMWFDTIGYSYPMKDHSSRVHMNTHYWIVFIDYKLNKVIGVFKVSEYSISSFL